MMIRKVLPAVLACTAMGFTACGKKDSKKDPAPTVTTPTQVKDRVVESPKTLAAALDLLKTQYCALTLKNTVTDRFSDITLPAGSTFLVSGTGFFKAKVFTIDADNELETVDVDAEDIAEVDCDPLSTNFDDRELVYFIDTPIYDNEELKGEPQCVIPAGTKLQNEYSFSGREVSFTELAKLCNGLTLGYEDNSPERVLLKK